MLEARHLNGAELAVVLLEHRCQCLSYALLHLKRRAAVGREQVVIEAISDGRISFSTTT